MDNLSLTSKEAPVHPRPEDEIKPSPTPEIPVEEPTKEAPSEKIPPTPPVEPPKPMPKAVEPSGLSEPSNPIIKDSDTEADQRTAEKILDTNADDMSIVKASNLAETVGNLTEK